MLTDAVGSDAFVVLADPRRMLDRARELIAGALASYLLGDSILQFSTVIGAYMFSMGVGSYISRYITRDLVARFVQVETMVGLVGNILLGLQLTRLDRYADTLVTRAQQHALTLSR